MSVDFSRYIQWTDNLVGTTRETNDRLRRLLSDMESVDRDIIKSEHDSFDPVLGSRRERSMKKENKEKAAAGEDVCPCGQVFRPNAAYCKYCGARKPGGNVVHGTNRVESKDDRLGSEVSKASSSRKQSLMGRTLTCTLNSS